MPYIFACLISHDKCSLKDIKYSIYLEECLLILDIIETDTYNERIMLNNNKKK